PPAPPAPPAPPSAEDEEEGGIARITLRLPESVKAKAEEFAARSGHSLNTWLVNVVRSATREGAINVDIDLSSLPFVGGNDPFGGQGPFGGGGKRGRRMTGWV
ncbi:MAG TPA: pilus assembly protein HicB, partial [Nocardioides sp.]|nr:pilus assembly protein HicB [Nocardioides sp.]